MSCGNLVVLLLLTEISWWYTMIHHQECSSYQTKMIWPLCVFCLPFSKLLNLDRINAVITRGILVRAGLANYHKIGNFKCQMTNLNVKFQLHWPLLWPGLYCWQLKSCQQICKKNSFEMAFSRPKCWVLLPRWHAECGWRCWCSSGGQNLNWLEWVKAASTAAYH